MTEDTFVSDADIDDEPLRPPPPLRAGAIAAWQALVLANGAVVLMLTGRGEVASLMLGGGLLYASKMLQKFAAVLATGARANPGLAIVLFTMKLGLLMAVAAVGLSTPWIAPMSFAAGATSLLVAIVLDACYEQRSRKVPSAD